MRITDNIFIEMRKSYKKIVMEIGLLHLVLILAGKLFLGLGIGIMISSYALPYSYPLVAAGTLILLPSLYYLFRREEKEEEILERKLAK